MWLQISSEATATVRILGQYTMVTHDIKYKFGEVVAAVPTEAFKARVP
jgi:hypothetical protein